MYFSKLNHKHGKFRKLRLVTLIGKMAGGRPQKKVRDIAYLSGSI